jgi:hypothetical protein
MNPAFLIVGSLSFAVGALCVAFPKFLGVNFNRLSRSIWERHQDDLPGQIKREIGNAFPAITPDFNDDARSSRTFRILGIVFLLQAVLLFVLSVMIP